MSEIDIPDIPEGSLITKLEPYSYYGSLAVAAGTDGKYYWSVDNFSGREWFVIPEYLYKAIMRHHAETEAEKRS